jgi:hypothetical protein
MKYDSSEFTVDDATHLLKKKLRGILQSSRNSLLKWDKQILHVWLFDEGALNSLEKAWSMLDLELKTNTVLLLTVAKNSNEVFFNQVAKLKKKKRVTI